MRSLLALTLALAVSAHAQDLPRDLRVPGGIAVLPIGSDDIAPQASFDGHRVAVAQCPEGWCAVVGLSLDLNVGDQRLTVTQAGVAREIPFTIQPKEYEVQRLKSTRKFVELSTENLKRYERDKAATQRAFTTWSDEIPALRFALPVSGRLSSLFGLRRYFNDQPRAPHSGIDIAAPEGTPIHAPAAGIVIEIGDYFFNGNTVFVDHGQGVVSMFNHLHRITVKPGAVLTAGDKIGEVGSTGRVTGPHLHWSVSLNNARVDPMLLLSAEALTQLDTKP